MNFLKNITSISFLKTNGCPSVWSLCAPVGIVKRRAHQPAPVVCLLPPHVSLSLCRPRATHIPVWPTAAPHPASNRRKKKENKTDSHREWHDTPGTGRHHCYKSIVVPTTFNRPRRGAGPCHCPDQGAAARRIVASCPFENSDYAGGGWRRFQGPCYGSCAAQRVAARAGAGAGAAAAAGQSTGPQGAGMPSFADTKLGGIVNESGQ